MTCLKEGGVVNKFYNKRIIFTCIILLALVYFIVSRPSLSFFNPQVKEDTNRFQLFKFDDSSENNRSGGTYHVRPVDDEGGGAYVRRIRNRPLYSKEVFLTFDDGPSKVNTPKIINILQNHGVKATFFIVGSKAEENPDILRQLDQTGMSIVSHSYTHEYSIYESVKSYFEDLNACNNTIRTILNKDPLPFIRFPGGSNNKLSGVDNMKRIRRAVKGREIKYVDWNVSSADAAAATVATSAIRNNVISQCKNTNFAVVLMHDSNTKVTTVEALSGIIEYLKNEGFVFRTFDDITPAEEKEMINRGIINR
jgi:peptidoglycan-N-acetylglucosamine deacetylase